MTSQDWVTLFGTAFTAITAGFAAVVTWWQYDLSRKQFRFELYERRLAVFHGAQRVFAAVVRSGAATYAQMDSFRVDTSEAEFLFDEDVLKQLKRLEGVGFDLAATQDALYPEPPAAGLPVGEERAKAATRKQALQRQLLVDILPDFKSAFAKHLRVE